MAGDTQRLWNSQESFQIGKGAASNKALNGVEYYEILMRTETLLVVIEESFKSCQEANIRILNHLTVAGGGVELEVCRRKRDQDIFPGKKATFKVSGGGGVPPRLLEPPPT